MTTDNESFNRERKTKSTVKQQKKPKTKNNEAEDQEEKSVIDLTGKEEDESVDDENEQRELDREMVSIHDVNPGLPLKFTDFIYDFMPILDIVYVFFIILILILCRF